MSADEIATHIVNGFMLVIIIGLLYFFYYTLYKIPEKVNEVK